jgi:HAD superfamily hydrolase (TIGR01509 family)
MIRALIFDCFGVLAEDGWSPFKRQYLSDPALARRVAAVGKAVDEGQASYDEMIHQTAHIAGVEEAVVRVAVERKVPNELLLALITRLKPAYKIGMLSNASYNVTAFLFEPEQSALFDATALSYELGLTKPDLAMYQAIAYRLQVPVAECLLVDDQARHCAGAIDAGMQAVEYHSVAQLEIELARAGIELGY